MMIEEKPGLGPPGRPIAPVWANRRRRLHGALSWLGVVLLLGFFAALIALEFHLI